MTRRLCILIALCAYASKAQPEEVELQRFGEVGLSCNAYQFRCRDGQCIASDAVCDGAVDCRDGSDESRLECSRSASCGPRAFRCHYGACVDGDAVCNGIRDCADNSDETLPSCRGPGAGSSSPGSGSQLVQCNQNQYRCEDGLQCIDSTSTCDGAIDCLDKSDETVSLCGSFNCPHRVFRCQYGACIDMNKKCDGVVNCADGSDESVSLCGEQSGGGGSSTRPHKDPFNTNSPRPTSKPSSQRPTPRPTPPPPVTPTTERCKLPDQPDNGKWLLERSECPGNSDCKPQPGVTHLEPGTQLVYSCNKGYALNATASVFCARNAKWSAIPSCQQIRCEPLNSAAVDAQCRFEGDRVSCDNSVLPDTTAQLSCRNSYTQDVSDLTRRDNVRCNAWGQWEPKPIKCVSVCGIAATGDGTPLIVNGSRSSVSEFPWHGTLYKQKGNNKQFICGATIIKDDLMITAAHCVYDEVKRKGDNPSLYYVAVGNIFRDYDYEGHDPKTVKKGKVKQIIVDCKYYGLEGNYASDIAILKLEKAFTFSSIVMPICLDTSPLGDQLVLEAGNYGKVAGFGRTAKGESSFILQSLTVPYISLNTCKSSSIASNSERYITIDKFCAGYQNGSSVCDGDSGGGLVFKTDNKWYLRGIVSVGIGATKLGATRTCDSYAYSLYTRVSSHMEWVQDVILRLEKNRPAFNCS